MTEVAATSAEATALAKTGATPADLSQGQSLEGAPKQPPAPSNSPPAVVPDTAAIAAAAAKKAKEDAAVIAAADQAAIDAEAPKPDAEKVDWQDGYIKFDDPSAQAVVDLLEEGNVSVVEANAFFADAIKLGDPTKIDWVGVEKKLGPAKTQLAKVGVEKYYNDVLSVQRRAVTDTYAELGGEANWLTLRTWAQAQELADPTGNFKAKVDGYRKMINLGGEPRRLAVAQLKSHYDADPNTKGFGTTNIVQGDNVGVTGAEPMTRKDYVAALHKAQADRAPHSVFKALQNRRTAGMAAGI